MKTKELIQKEIEVFPEPYLEEVLDFIHLLKEKGTCSISCGYRFKPTQCNKIINSSSI